MAVTKIKPIRGTVNKALAYILDPKKTDDELYVSSYGCAASDAAAKEFEWTRNLAVQQGMQMPKVIARHLIQSFDVGEVTPEQAHEIGKQFADEWLKGKYEYVIATHIDKGHCHNHIIFNAVNYVDFHAYRSNKQTYRQMRQLSDEICKEHGLSVIPPSQSKGMSYKEYTEAKRGTSWKQKLKQTIDRCVITAKDYDEFLKMMQDAGYEIKTGKYISFRAAAAIILSLLIVIIFGRSIIDFLRRKQIGEDIRDLGLEGQLQKRGTPTMGGVIILLAILVPILLFGRLDNIYIQLMIVSTVWLGLIGGLDDYIKVFRHNKEGLKGRFKIVGQVGLGIIVGTTMWLSPQIIVREKVTQPVQTVYLNPDGSVIESVQRNVVLSSESTKTTKTTIPFVKNNEFDYGWLTGEDSATTWLLYVLVAIFVVTAVSNGANLTDGLDGLATGVSVPIVAVLGVLAYLSGHIVYADYLNIMYIPDSGELVVFDRKSVV